MYVPFFYNIRKLTCFTNFTNVLRVNSDHLRVPWINGLLITGYYMKCTMFFGRKEKDVPTDGTLQKVPKIHRPSVENR